MEPLSMLTFGAIKTLIMEFLKTYGLKGLFAIAAIVGVYHYGQLQYDKGVAITTVKYQKQNEDALLAQKTTFENKIVEIQKKNKQLEADKLAAQVIADKIRHENTVIYTKLEEIRRETKTSVAGQSTPFTVGFVGLYNVAFETADGRAEQTGPVDVFTVVRASRIGERSPAPSLSDPIAVTTDQVLDVTTKNAELLGTCIADRKAMKEFFIKICNRGDCTASGSAIKQALGQ